MKTNATKQTSQRLIAILALVFPVVLRAAEQPNDVAGNFTLLMADSWKTIGAFVLGFAMRILGGAVLGAILGLIAGIIFYLWLRSRRLFDAPWRPYRFFRWLWVPVVVISMLIGGCSTGAWIGGGAAAKRAVQEGQLIRRIVANLYCAVALDQAEYELKGRESASQIVRTLQTNEHIVGNFTTMLGAQAKVAVEKDLETRGLNPRLRGMLLKVVSNETLGNMLFSEGRTADTRTVVVMLYLSVAGGDGYQQFLKDNPQQVAVAAAVGRFFQELDRQALSSIRSLVRTSVATCLLLGLGIPLGLCAALRGIVRLTTPHGPPPLATTQAPGR